MKSNSTIFIEIHILSHYLLSGYQACLCLLRCPYLLKGSQVTTPKINTTFILWYEPLWFHTLVLKLLSQNQKSNDSLISLYMSHMKLHMLLCYAYPYSYRKSYFSIIPAIEKWQSPTKQEVDIGQFPKFLQYIPHFHE